MLRDRLRLRDAAQAERGGLLRLLLLQRQSGTPSSKTIIPGPGLALTNVGDTTLRDLTVEITQNPESDAEFFIAVEQGDVSEELPKRWRLSESERIHPGECLEFQPDLFSVIPGTHWDGPARPAPLKWTVYLEDGPPTSDVINFVDIGFAGDGAQPI